MKTSNKIITGFFLFVFILPLFLLMAFKSKIRNGDFVIVKNEMDNQYAHSGSLQPYKVIRIEGPAMESIFSCTIYPATAATYDYTS
jgi:hypothetical protein